MKVKFEFDTSRDDHDRKEMTRIIKATDMAICLYDIKALLYKDNLSADSILQCFEDNDIDLNYLIE